MENVTKPGVALSMAGRTALITGGSRGIGAATVQMFCQSGAQVFFNYRTSEAQATRLIADCGGSDCQAIRQELATPSDGAVLVRAAVEAFGRLDCLVVNRF